MYRKLIIVVTLLVLVTSSSVVEETHGFSTSSSQHPAGRLRQPRRRRQEQHRTVYYDYDGNGYDPFKLSRRTPVWIDLAVSTISTTETVVNSSNDEPEETRHFLSKTLIDDFVQHLYESTKDQSFVSLTLYGVKRPRERKDIESVRGCIRQVHGRLVVISASSSKNKAKKKKQHQQQEEEVALQLTFKYHLATDIVKNIPIQSVTSGLSAILDPSQHQQSDDTDNTSIPGLIASEWGEDQVQSQPIQRAELVVLGTAKDSEPRLWELRLSDRTPSLKKRSVPRSHPSFEAAAASALDNDRQNEALSHDRVKKVPLAGDDLFLQKLGITTSDGKPRKGMQSKLRQCQKFVEIVCGLISKSTGNQQSEDNYGDDDKYQKRKSKDKIQIVDMGCGRGYLTFSLHSYLSSTYDASDVSTVGIDVRPKLVNEMNSIATDLGGPFGTLKFEEGTIEGFVTGTATNDHQEGDGKGALQVLVALHACDTATDDALWYGIARQVDVIVVAPCCHKQIRSQLDAHYVSSRHNHPLSEILRHGIYRERHAETVTDSIRAMLLELAGYKVQVFEFIGGEHTSKNVMLSAVKARHPMDDQKKQSIHSKIMLLASFHGIRKQKLADWMGVKLSDDIESTAAVQRSSQIRMPPVSPSSLPPKND